MKEWKDSSRRQKPSPRAVIRIIRFLTRLKKGELVRIRHGVYARPKQLAGTMIDIETIVPNGILCMFSAWSVYNLTTVIPQSYHIGIKREGR